LRVHPGTNKEEPRKRGEKREKGFVPGSKVLIARAHTEPN